MGLPGLPKTRWGSPVSQRQGGVPRFPAQVPPKQGKKQEKEFEGEGEQEEECDWKEEGGREMTDGGVGEEEGKQKSQKEEEEDQCSPVVA